MSRRVEDGSGWDGLLPSAEERREGHSALRVKAGKLEKFDPHPAASSAMGAERSPELLAEHLEECWPEIAAFFTERNWPDTKLGRAAATINGDVQQIVHELRGGWIPVTERLPDDDITVMVALKDTDEPVWLGYHDEDGWRSATDAVPLTKLVTHWRPMLESPNG